MSASSTKPAILLVDDEPSCLQMFDLRPGRHGIPAYLRHQADDALKLARERNPHLVLLDVMMPEMDGFAVCQNLRQEPTTQNLAIIFLSALQDPQERTRGIELGAVDFITKPFEPSEVRARVRRQVELQEERRKLLALAGSPEERLAKIIAGGENDRTEFKSTLRWSVKENKVNHGVEIAWLKTVAAFLNTDGGNLVVGVNDKGIPLGIRSTALKTRINTCCMLITACRNTSARNMPRTCASAFFRRRFEGAAAGMFSRVQTGFPGGCRPGVLLRSSGSRHA
jgi:DNA-binding response OmpR family regulator